MPDSGAKLSKAELDRKLDRPKLTKVNLLIHTSNLTDRSLAPLNTIPGFPALSVKIRYNILSLVWLWNGRCLNQSHSGHSRISLPSWAGRQGQSRMKSKQPFLIDSNTKLVRKVLYSTTSRSLCSTHKRSGSRLNRDFSTDIYHSIHKDMTLEYFNACASSHLRERDVVWAHKILHKPVEDCIYQSGQEEFQPLRWEKSSWILTW